jgi:hypothetical protein
MRLLPRPGKQTTNPGSKPLPIRGPLAEWDQRIPAAIRPLPDEKPKVRRSHTPLPAHSVLSPALSAPFAVHLRTGRCVRVPQQPFPCHTQKTYTLNQALDSLTLALYTAPGRSTPDSEEEGEGAGGSRKKGKAARSAAAEAPAEVVYTTLVRHFPNYMVQGTLHIL